VQAAYETEPGALGEEQWFEQPLGLMPSGLRGVR